MDERTILRQLWQRPGKYLDRQMDRSVTFLELFFDLVFVVMVAQLAHQLAKHPDWEGVAWFAFLFYAVWTSWVDGTSYHDAHGTDDLSIRVFTFAQMLTVAAMAVYIGDIPGDGAEPFALAYAANSVLLALIWLRTAYHDLEHRLTSAIYGASHLLSATIFALSVTQDDPARTWFWIVAVGIEVAGIVVVGVLLNRQYGAFEATESMVERFGLFMIIVLGEVVAGAINGLTELEEVDFSLLIVGGLGVLVAVGMWWIYFDLLGHREPRADRTYPWIFLHYVLAAGIAATGAAVLYMVEHAEESLGDDARWLLVGSVAAGLAATAALPYSLRAREELQPAIRAGQVAIVGAGLAVLLLGFTSLDATPTLVVVDLILLVPIAVAVVVWARTEIAARREREATP